MAILRIDPPPNTDNVRVLQAYVSDLYEALTNVLSNIDEDNINEEFLNTINRLNGGGE